ncbi:MAG: UvrD-helicase domain-containing protein [Myxococcales bacterium]
MAELRDLYRQPRSAVLQAGAGTGKTHSLVTLCLHALAGVGRPEPLAPARLWAVTFSEKAAAELKSRIQKRVDRLATASVAEVREIEPELWESTGGSPPAASHWRRVLRDLGLAQIDTLHGICAQLLRRHAAVAGIDPDFALLDEVEAKDLRARTSLGTILDALDGKGPLADAARELCEEMGLQGGRFGGGLADELTALLSSLAESGRDVRETIEATAGLDERGAAPTFSAARSELFESVLALEHLLASNWSSRGAKTVAVATSALQSFRAAMAPLLAAAPGELSSAAKAVQAVMTLPRVVAGAGDASGRVCDAREALLEADAQVRSCRLARKLALLAGEAERRYRAEKARAQALDFDDLTRLARDLLASDPAVRALEKARRGLLLVDEFQDTSRAQLELLGWLAEGSQEGTAPPCSGLPGAAPMSSSTVVVVGDRKQSIYEFRGADVAGAGAFAQRAIAEGAQPCVLRTSRRSVPQLVRFANALFRVALSAGEHPFDTPFTDDDALEAHRTEGGAGARAELVDVTGSGIESEARVVADRIARLLSPSAPERVFEGDVPRAVRGGDIAILLRRSTNVDVFRRALLRRRIPHIVLKGRGFYDSREVQDLLALLALACDREDTAALATVLRSPLGPLSDDALVLLARSGGRSALSWHAADDPRAAALLAPDDAVALRGIVSLVERLAREVDRLGPATLLEAALSETEYVAAIAAGLAGEQAVANVQKLVALARKHEVGGGTARTFVALARRMQDLDQRESDAAVVEEHDPHAVRILTVHAAKGLEFPVVVVPECASISKPWNRSVLLDPELGLAVKVRAADGGPKRWGTSGRRIYEVHKQRDAAQMRRLLYVACTRARDFLILSGRAARPSRNGRPGPETWRACLDAALPMLDGLLRVLPDGLDGAEALPAATVPAGDRRDEIIEALSSGLPLSLPAPDPALAAAVEEARIAVARAAMRPRGGESTIVAPVTQLADASICARRYQLLYELGLDEHPAPGATPSRAAELGTLAHRLLENVALDLPREERGRHLARLLELEGGDAADPGHAEVVAAVEAFLDDPLAARMARAGTPPRLHRELPFALRVGPGLVVRGQLDALLVDGDAATVIDYKLSRGSDAAARYGFQLDAYALAADRLVEGAVPVQSSLVFLRSRGGAAGPRIVEQPRRDPEELRRVEARLVEAGKVLAEGRRTGVWPRIDEARCREAGCGFVRRCHGRKEVAAT